MASKRVLIVEDDKQKRNALHERLDVRGFEVYSAGRGAEARALFQTHWESTDVIILDMRLKDPDEPDVTGADIAIQFRQAKKCYSPEFLIYSAYPEVNYYRLALKLGVAAYLGKDEFNELDVIRHVRVLALCHALSSDNQTTADEMMRIASQSHSRLEAIETFCQEVLKPEFESCLGAPFVVLLSDGGTTWNCTESAELPREGGGFYHTLQALAHGKGSLVEPFVIDANNPDVPATPEAERLYGRLDGAAFVPLVSHDFKLSVGILQEKEGETPVPEDAQALCKLLAQYLRPTVLENLLNLWPRWMELRTIRTSTARLCLFVGQELEDLLPSEGDDAPAVEESLGRLWGLANDLTDTGQMLNDLDIRRRSYRSMPVSVRDIVVTSWQWITEGEPDAASSFEVEGDCTVEADRRDLEIAVSRLLHWLAQRRDATPFDEAPLVSVKCRDDLDGPTVIFEDRSQRLNKKLRADMFAPFTQAVPVPFAPFTEAAPAEVGGAAPGEVVGGGVPRRVSRYLPLYLAKVLVEGRYHGTLKDHSDDEDIKNLSYRHRIVMRFPSAVKRS
jgi:CheY-like chemotaxis protein